MIALFALIVTFFTKTPRDLMAMVLMAIQFTHPDRATRRRFRALAQRMARRLWLESKQRLDRVEFLKDPGREIRKAHLRARWMFLAAVQPDSPEYLMRRAQREAGKMLADAKKRYRFAAGMYATTKMHTDVASGAPANASVWNTVFGTLDSALADTEGALGDFVATGGLAGTSASLVISVPALRAFVQNTYVQVATSPLTVTLNQDTYVDVDSSGVLRMSGVANGAAAPVLFANSIRLFKAVSGATAVTSVVDLRLLNPLGIFNPRNYGAKFDGVTDDGAALQLANNAAAIVKGAVFIPPCVCLVNTPVNVSSNVTFFAFRGTVTFKRTIVGSILQNVVGTLDQVSVIGINFDMTGVGWSAILFTGSDAAGQVTNLLVRDCVFKAPSSTWMLQVMYTIVDPAIPTSKNRGIKIEDCVDDAAGGTFTLENWIFVNCQDVFVSGCRLLNTPATLAAHIAIYGYCRNVRLVGNYFENYLSPRGVYCIQSDGISFIGDQCRTTGSVNGIEIFNCQDVKVLGCQMTFPSTGNAGVNINDFAGATFDAHTNLYSASSGVTVQDCRMGLMVHAVLLNVAAVQGQTDIQIQGNMVTPQTSLFRISGMPAAPSAAIKRITIQNNHITTHSGVSGGTACVAINGNASAANGGVQTVVVQGNLFNQPGGGGCDVEVLNLADDVLITGNRHLGAAVPIVIAAVATNVVCWGNQRVAQTPTTSTLGVNVTSMIFTGNNYRGTIAIVMAGALAANTKIGTCTFPNSPYGATVPRIRLINQTSGAGLANVNFYVLATGTGQTFDIACNQALALGTYTVAYDIVPAGLN